MQNTGKCNINQLICSISSAVFAMGAHPTGYTMGKIPGTALYH